MGEDEPHSWFVSAALPLEPQLLSCLRQNWRVQDEIRDVLPLREASRQNFVAGHSRRRYIVRHCNTAIKERAMPKSFMLVFSSPTGPDQEAEYNEWYTGKHLKDVVALPGFVAATRYKFEKAVGLDGIPASGSNYLAIYEVEGDTVADMEAVKQQLADGMAQGTVDLSPALDVASLQTDFARQVSERVTKA